MMAISSSPLTYHPTRNNPIIAAVNPLAEMVLDFERHIVARVSGIHRRGVAIAGELLPIERVPATSYHAWQQSFSIDN
jgi:hypothetical protein